MLCYTLLIVTIKTAHSITVYNVVRCTKGTKKRQFSTFSGYRPQRIADHAHAFHQLRDVLWKPRTRYRDEALPPAGQGQFKIRLLISKKLSSLYII